MDSVSHGLNVDIKFKRGPYRIDQYRPLIYLSPNATATPVFTGIGMPTKVDSDVYSSAIGLVRYSIMSSKYIVPAPPGIAIFPLVPRPIASL